MRLPQHYHYPARSPINRLNLLRERERQSETNRIIRPAFTYYDQHFDAHTILTGEAHKRAVEIYKNSYANITALS